MPQKKILLLLLLFIFLVFVWIAIRFIQRQPKEQKIFIKIKLEDITSLKIIKKTEEFFFEKVGDTWRIKKPIDYKANQENIKEVINSIPKINLKDVISTNKEKFSNFHVDEENGIRIEWSFSDKTETIIVGKMLPDFESCYLKLPFEDKVYVASGIKRFTVDKELSGWRDKTIFQCKKDEIKKIKIKRKTDTIEITKIGENWFVNAKPANMDNINPIINFFVDLQTDEFADYPKKLEKIEKKKFEVVVSTAISHTFKFGEYKDNLSYLQVDDNLPIFLIYNYRIEPFQKKKEDLILK